MKKIIFIGILGMFLNAPLIFAQMEVAESISINNPDVNYPDRSNPGRNSWQAAVQKYDPSVAKWRYATPSDYVPVEYKFPYPCNSDWIKGTTYVHETHGSVERYCRHGNGAFEAQEIVIMEGKTLQGYLDMTQ